jgi:hypothetical protein
VYSIMWWDMIYLVCYISIFCLVYLVWYILSGISRLVYLLWDKAPEASAPIISVHSLWAEADWCSWTNQLSASAPSTTQHWSYFTCLPNTNWASHVVICISDLNKNNKDLWLNPSESMQSIIGNWDVTIRK